MSEENQISDGNFFNLMDSKLNEETSFPQEQMAQLTDEFMAMKEQYANGDKKQHALLEAEVVQRGDRISKEEMFKTNLASLLGSGSKIGHSPTEKMAGYTQDVIDIVNGDNKPTYDGNTPGYELHDGWRSMDDIEKMVKSRNVDESSKELIQTMISDQQSLASEIQPGDNAEFNFQKVHNNVKTKIIEQGNINSLATDKIFGNRVFKDDLLSAIENGTYGELGLTEEVIQNMDPTPDGKISTEDAAQITSGILQDDDMLKTYLTDYYVKAIEQNFYDNLNPDVRKAKAKEAQQLKKNTLQQKPQLGSDFKIDIKKRGGKIKNGVYVPNAAK